MGLLLLIHPDILFGFNIENAITNFIYPITSSIGRTGYSGFFAEDSH